METMEEDRAKPRSERLLKDLVSMIVEAPDRKELPSLSDGGTKLFDSCCRDEPLAPRAGLA